MMSRRQHRVGEMELFGPAVEAVELEDSGIARFIDIEMEEAGYLSDSINSTDYGLSPMSEPDIMPTLIPMCKPEHDSKSTVDDLDSMPSLSPVPEIEPDLTPMEPLDDLYVPSIEEYSDTEMTPFDLNEETANSYPSNSGDSENSFRGLTSKDSDLKGTNSMAAIKLESMPDSFDKTDTNKSIDNACIGIFGTSEFSGNKTKGNNLDEKNNNHQKVNVTKVLKPVSKSSVENKIFSNINKTKSHEKESVITDISECGDGDYSTSDIDFRQLPDSCKEFSSCQCGQNMCRKVGKCYSHHTIIADKHKNLVTYKKVISITPTSATKAGKSKGRGTIKDNQTGNRTKLKENKDKYFVADNIGVKVSDFVHKKAAIDNDIPAEVIKAVEVSHGQRSDAGHADSKLKNKNVLQICKKVTVDLVDVLKTRERCNKRTTVGEGNSSDSMTSSSNKKHLNCAFDKENVEDGIYKVLGGSEVTVRLKDVFKDKCALRGLKLRGSDGSSIKLDDNCAVNGLKLRDTDISSFKYKNTAHGLKPRNKPDSPGNFDILEQQTDLRKTHSGWENCVKTMNQGKRRESSFQRIKGKRQKSFGRKEAHKKLQRNNPRPSKIKNIIYAHVSGKLSDGCGSQDSSKNILNTPSRFEREPNATGPQDESRGAQGHFLHTFGLLETAQLFQEAGEDTDTHLIRSARVRKKTPKALALEQEKLADRQWQLIKNLKHRETKEGRHVDKVIRKTPKALALKQQKLVARQWQFKKSLQQRETKEGRHVYQDSGRNGFYKLENLQQLNFRKSRQSRINVRFHTKDQKLKPRGWHFQPLTSQKPFPVLLLKARNPWADKQKANGSEPHLLQVPETHSNFSSTHGAQEVLSNGERSDVSLIRSSLDSGLSNGDERIQNERYESESSHKVIDKPKSPALFSGTDETEMFIVVRNKEVDVDADPSSDNSEVPTLVRSSHGDIMSTDSEEMRLTVAENVLVNAESEWSRNADILMNKQNDEFADVQDENIEIKTEPVAPTDRMVLEGDINVLNAPAEIDKAISSIGGSGLQLDFIPLNTIPFTQTKTHPVMFSLLNQDYQVDQPYQNEILLSACETEASCYESCTDSTSRSFKLVNWSDAAGSRIVDTVNSDDNQLATGSDTEEEIDVVSVDTSIGLAASEYLKEEHNYCGKLETSVADSAADPRSSARTRRLNQSNKILQKNRDLKIRAVQKKINAFTFKQKQLMKQHKTIAPKTIAPKAKLPISVSPVVLMLPQFNVPVICTRTSDQSTQKLHVESAEIEDQSNNMASDCSDTEVYKMRRFSHNFSELKRRSDVKKKFYHLRDLLPELRGNDKVSKKAILYSATKYISELEKQLTTNEEYLTQLSTQHTSLQKTLEKLQIKNST